MVIFKSHFLPVARASDTLNDPSSEINNAKMLQEIKGAVCNI